MISSQIAPVIQVVQVILAMLTRNFLNNKLKNYKGYKDRSYQLRILANNRFLSKELKRITTQVLKHQSCLSILQTMNIQSSKVNKEVPSSHSSIQTWK